MRLLKGLFLIALLAGGAHAAPILSGLVNFSTDSTGATSGGYVWNTLGGDIFFNLYLRADTQAGTALNSGNAAGVALNQALVEGDNTFVLIGQPGPAGPAFFGLNIFLDGLALPALSAFSAVDGGSIAANSSTTTRNLDGGNVAGAGTLSVNSGGFLTTVTSYLWYAPANVPTSGPFSGPADLVQAFNNVPGNGNDWIGVLTLNVQSTGVIPEPSTMLLLGGALLGLGLLRRAN